MGVQWPEEGNVVGAPPPAPLITSAKPQFPGLLMWVVSVVWVAQASLPQARVQVPTTANSYTSLCKAGMLKARVGKGGEFMALLSTSRHLEDSSSRAGDECILCPTSCPTPPITIFCMSCLPDPSCLLKASI